MGGERNKIDGSELEVLIRAAHGTALQHNCGRRESREKKILRKKTQSWVAQRWRLPSEISSCGLVVVVERAQHSTLSLSPIIRLVLLINFFLFLLLLLLLFVVREFFSIYLITSSGGSRLHYRTISSARSFPPAFWLINHWATQFNRWWKFPDRASSRSYPDSYNICRKRKSCLFFWFNVTHTRMWRLSNNHYVVAIKGEGAVPGAECRRENAVVGACRRRRH
jgi:hypothetical protein